MTDLVDHAFDLGGVFVLNALPDPPEAERSERLTLPLIGAVLRAALGDLDAAHAEVSSDASAGDGAASSATRGRSAPEPFPDPSLAVAADAASVPANPSTWLIESPRSSATSPGVRSDSRPVIVAFTRLIGFCEPKLLESTSRIPASSRTARTPPPAITPVPGDAGLSKTDPDPNRPVT